MTKFPNVSIHYTQVQKMRNQHMETQKICNCELKTTHIPLKQAFTTVSSTTVASHLFNFPLTIHNTIQNIAIIICEFLQVNHKQINEQFNSIKAASYCFSFYSTVLNKEIKVQPTGIQGQAKSESYNQTWLQPKYLATSTQHLKRKKKKKEKNSTP